MMYMKLRSVKDVNIFADGCALLKDGINDVTHQIDNLIDWGKYDSKQKEDLQ